MMLMVIVIRIFSQSLYHHNCRYILIFHILLSVRYDSNITLFVRVICALFSILAAEKSGCVKYADFWGRS